MINLVVIREDNNTVWSKELDEDDFYIFFDEVFRLWFKKIQKDKCQ